jgi:hypothetical protein
MCQEIVSVACKVCHKVFEPDVKTKKAWQCSSCSAKNPNLKRHYRSVADLMILGLIVTTFILIAIVIKRGISVGALLLTSDAILLLVTITLIYKSATPWTDRLANVLIWIVFGVAFFTNVVIPFVFVKRLSPLIVIYLLIFLYLFWLKRAAVASTRPRLTPPSA